jgi:outer membrane protein
MYSKKIIIAFAAAIVLLAGACGYMFFSKPKTAYITIKEVYDSFEMKKELEKKYISVKNARQRKLDSLQMDLKGLGEILDKQLTKNPADINLFTTKRDSYLYNKQKMEEDNTALSNQYDRQIIDQLNQYVKDYGAEKGYSYIFGNDGSGSLMFADTKNDITGDVAKYINKKYNGK